MDKWYVYILASKRNGTLYVGVTNDLAKRIDQHRKNGYSSFTTKYHVYLLVFYEAYDYPLEAIKREKNIKSWKRLWKLNLIETTNPDWKDLSLGLLD